MTEAGPIGDSGPRSVLIVAHRTAATPALLATVSRRASEGACRFTLLVPRAFWDADTEESAVTLELAIPLLEEAAGGRVEGLIGGEDPFQAISAALGARRYDEIIVSTLPAHVSHWLHVDLPARVRRLRLCPSRSSPRGTRARPSGRRLSPAGDEACPEQARAWSAP
jgi:hypothetical protein